MHALKTLVSLMKFSRKKKEPHWTPESAESDPKSSFCRKCNSQPGKNNCYKKPSVYKDDKT